MEQPRSVGTLGACVALLLSWGALVVSPAGAQQAPDWTVIELEPLEGDTDTQVTDVNNLGYAVGRSDVTPVVWTPQGDPIELPLPDGASSGLATGINDSGIVVGSIGWPAPVPGRDAVAWVYGTIVPIAENADVLDITNTHTVAGCQGGSDGDGRRPFVARLGDDPIALPTDAEDGPAGCAVSLTTWGAAGGHQRTTPAEGPGISSGVVWFDGETLDLDNAPQHVWAVHEVTETGALLVEVASSASATAPRHAAIGFAGQYAVLAPSAPSSSAAGLNSWGIAVGTREQQGNGSGSEPFHEPVLWVYGATFPLADLTPSGDLDLIVGSQPVAISDRNVIAGNRGQTSWLMRPPG